MLKTTPFFNDGYGNLVKNPLYDPDFLADEESDSLKR